MTRPIRFRAWYEERKCFMYTGIESWKWYDESKENSFGKDVDSARFLMEPEQFTCLLDKNGKEIYEGDILSEKDYEGMPTVVRFQSGHGNNAVGYWEGFYMPERPWEIIGNIHENPELISPNVE